MKKPTVLVFNFGGGLKISPPIWPDHRIDIDPGDLTKFTPMGNGVYGYQDNPIANPFKGAPPQEETGGILYFGSSTSRDDFNALMRITGVQESYNVNPSKQFAAFRSLARRRRTEQCISFDRRVLAWS